MVSVPKNVPWRRPMAMVALAVAAVLTLLSLSALTAGASSTPDMQVRPVLSAGSGCTPAGTSAQPSATQNATLPSWGARRTCYDLGPSGFDLTQALGVMAEWSPQGDIVNIELSNEQASSLHAEIGSASSQSAVVMFGQVLSIDDLSSTGTHTIELHFDGSSAQADDLAAKVKSAFARDYVATSSSLPIGSSSGAAAAGTVALFIGFGGRRRPKRPSAAPRVDWRPPVGRRPRTRGHWQWRPAWGLATCLCTIFGFFRGCDIGRAQ